MTPPGTNTKPATADRFAGAVASRVDDLRRSTAQVIDALPQRSDRAADLGRALNLDSALAWQLHSVASQVDAVVTARLVPKQGAMDRFVVSARKAGVKEDLLTALIEAYDRFSDLVESEAGDRETFDAMVSALRPDDAAAMQKIRRTAFRANAAVWGVTSRCEIRSVVFHNHGGEQECLVVRGRIGLRRLRMDAPLQIYASSRTWGKGQPPLDTSGEATVDACELIPDYCSVPIPEVVRMKHQDGSMRDFLQLDGVGRSNEVTVFWRNVAAHFGGTPEPPHGLTVPCLDPAETLLAHLLLPKGWTNPKTARVWITPESARLAGAGQAQLPFEGAVEHLGNRLDDLRDPAAPRYGELMKSELARIGWDDTEFDIYRCVVKYPILHSCLNMGVG